MSNTAAVVVTYNRKLELISALEAIFNQSELPKKLFIIDNKSTDGTSQHLLDNNVLSALPRLDSDADEHHLEVKQIDDTKQIEICYVRKAENNGGAGGFYKGMKLAYEGGFDWIWMMDDDGIPANNQLEELLTVSRDEKKRYVNALLIDKDDHSFLAFGLKGYEKVEEIVESHIIERFVNPFNGTLIARSLIDEIGLIKREMFIWGDEKEYTLRVVKNGDTPTTILSAVHYHPKIKGVTTQVLPFFNAARIILKPERFEHNYYRNLGYIETNYASPKVSKVTRALYSIYFLSRFKIKAWKKFMKYYKRGMENNFVND